MNLLSWVNFWLFGTAFTWLQENEYETFVNGYHFGYPLSETVVKEVRLIDTIFECNPSRRRYLRRTKRCTIGIPFRHILFIYSLSVQLNSDIWMRDNKEGFRKPSELGKRLYCMTQNQKVKCDEAKTVFALSEVVKHKQRCTEALYYKIVQLTFYTL